MRHRVFATCSILSLILCAVLCVLWVRSYWGSDRIAWNRHDGLSSARTAYGNFVVRILHYQPTTPANQEPRLEYSRDRATSAELDLMGVFFFLACDLTAKTVEWRFGNFGWIHREASATSIAVAVAPFWSLTSAAMILPIVWFASTLRSRFRAHPGMLKGFCPTCGYDLRATPERCPECGKRVETVRPGA